MKTRFAVGQVVIGRVVLGLGVLTMTCMWGCRDQGPSPRYNYAMADSEGGRRLLPINRPVSGWRDASILNNDQATIIRRDEMDTPEAAAMVTGEAAEMTEDSGPPTTPGEALKRVGSSFLGSLMNPDSGAGNNGATETGASASTNSGGGEAGIQQVLSEYSADLAAGRYLKLAAHCAKTQKVKAVDYFDILDEMNTSVSSLLVAYEKSSPGVKAKYEQMLSQKRAEATVGAVSVDGTNATAELTGADGNTVTMSMVDESGSWRLILPVIEGASDWSSFKDTLEELIVSLDDEVDELSGGGASDNSKLDKLFEEAIDYLSAMPK